MLCAAVEEFVADGEAGGGGGDHGGVVVIVEDVRGGGGVHVHRAPGAKKVAGHLRGFRRGDVAGWVCTVHSCWCGAVFCPTHTGGPTPLRLELRVPTRDR